MSDTSANSLRYRAALEALLVACEQFEDQFGWSGSSAYVDSWAEKRFDEARNALAAVAGAPVANEAPDTNRDALRALLSACREFTARFSDDRGKAYLRQDDEARWTAAREEAKALLRQKA